MIDYTFFALDNVQCSLVPLAFIGGMVGQYLVGRLLGGVVMTLVTLLSKPLLIGGLILTLMYYPDAVAWVLMKIGEIQLRIFSVLLAAIMPEVFPTSEVSSWAEVWNNAINQFPSGITDTMAALDLAGLLGMVTSCLTAGFTIRIYMRLVKRIGVI